MIFDILDNNSIGLGRSVEVLGVDCGDVQKSDVDEDSQQEYYSVELECISVYLAKIVSRFSLDVSELKILSYDFKCGGNFEDNYGKLESGFSFFLEFFNGFV